MTVVPALPPDLCKLLPFLWVLFFFSARGLREERCQLCPDLLPSPILMQLIARPFRPLYLSSPGGRAG